MFYVHLLVMYVVCVKCTEHKILRPVEDIFPERKRTVGRTRSCGKDMDITAAFLWKLCS